MSIRFEKLSKYYLESCALKEASGVINDKDKILVLGENGSGKSTFLKLISGQIAPSAGEVLYNEKLLTSNLRNRFSILGESKFLYLDLTLKENLELSLLSSEEKHRAEQLCKGFEIDILSPSTIRQFSSGQKQKAAVIRALSLKNEVLVLDEPLNFLDAGSKVKLAEILSSIEKTVVLVSHELDYFSGFRKMEIQHGVMSC